MTNREFAKSDEAFLKACKETGTAPTARQAGKFRRAHGSAFTRLGAMSEAHRESYGKKETTS